MLVCYTEILLGKVIHKIITVISVNDDLSVTEAES